MFVARHTFTPEYDAIRNWSGWIGLDFATEAEALAFDEEQGGNGDVRLNEAWGRWQIVHHDGLSCYALDAEDEAEAVAEATEKADHLDWFGFGDCTVGTVRLVARINETLCVFECHDVTGE